MEEEQGDSTVILFQAQSYFAPWLDERVSLAIKFLVTGNPPHLLHGITETASTRAKCFQAIFQISVECSKLNEASQEEKRGQTQQLTLCQFYVNCKERIVF